MSQEDSNQLQFDDFPAGFFGDLLGDDMSGLFGDSPPANVDPQSDSIDPALLQHGTYGVPFKLSDLDSIIAGGAPQSLTPALNHTPYTGDDTFGLLNTPDHGTPAAAVCTGIPFPEQGELSYPVVFDLEEHLASLDQIQLPQYTPIEASAADHEEAPQDSSSLFGASSPEQEGDPESQIPIGLESIGLILPAEAPLRPNETFPIATVIPSPLNASHEQGLVPGNNGDPSNYTEFPENQEITAGITKSLAPTTHLEIIRQIPVLQKMKDSPEELLIVYSVYEPLQPWGEFRYTTRGHLREDIIFDEESMQRFVRGIFFFLILLA
ncbi:hypothetical protein L873DRAFT_18187 [Choiromyces venosus 120613-1]|uniref:Uncharacterized protein n=1 Tax=Choiromyces venosus 120613-1 TaxID=1336337 RepID=A0A3N4K677_9PEZI|nr:hypothetical protein L873DRAFT_18187 [Choiromyces venosus 120613-1]